MANGGKDWVEPVTTTSPHNLWARTARCTYPVWAGTRGYRVRDDMLTAAHGQRVRTRQSLLLPQRLEYRHQDVQHFLRCTTDPSASAYRITWAAGSFGASLHLHLPYACFCFTVGFSKKNLSFVMDLCLNVLRKVTV